MINIHDKEKKEKLIKKLEELIIALEKEDYIKEGSLLDELDVFFPEELGTELLEIKIYLESSWQSFLSSKKEDDFADGFSKEGFKYTIKQLKNIVDKEKELIM